MKNFVKFAVGFFMISIGFFLFAFPGFIEGVIHGLQLTNTTSVSNVNENSIVFLDQGAFRGNLTNVISIILIITGFTYSILFPVTKYLYIKNTYVFMIGIFFLILSIFTKLNFSNNFMEIFSYLIFILSSIAIIFGPILPKFLSNYDDSNKDQHEINIAKSNFLEVIKFIEHQNEKVKKLENILNDIRLERNSIENLKTQGNIELFIKHLDLRQRKQQIFGFIIGVASSFVASILFNLFSSIN